ncbi:MAG: hypothetical protein AABW67_02515, partial [Nanoarchaeota archaeon]
YITSIEELVAQKASMGREKDINDLKLLKGFSINKELLNDFLNVWNTKNKAINLLKRIGYKI